VAAAAPDAASAARSGVERQESLERLAAEHGVTRGGAAALAARPSLSAEERANRVLKLLAERGTAPLPPPSHAAPRARAPASSPEPRATAARAARRAWSPAPARARSAPSPPPGRPASAPRQRPATALPPTPVPLAPFSLSSCSATGRHNLSKIAAEVATARAKDLTFRPQLNPPGRGSPARGEPDREAHLRQARALRCLRALRLR
jgi:hypothetical protein